MTEIERKDRKRMRSLEKTAKLRISSQKPQKAAKEWENPDIRRFSAVFCELRILLRSLGKRDARSILDKTPFLCMTFLTSEFPSTPSVLNICHYPLFKWITTAFLKPRTMH